MFAEHPRLSHWLVACTFALAACSGGSSGTSGSGGTTSGGGSSGSTGSVTNESLQSVTNLPDFNVDSLDAAATASVSAARTRFQEDGEDDGEEGQEFSRAGCEVRSTVEEFKYHLHELRGNICTLKQMLGDELFEFDATYYYEMLFEAGNTPGDSDEGNDFGFGARVKVALTEDTLSMQLCTNEVGGSDYTQMMAMTFAVEDGKFSGVVKDIFPSYLDSSVMDGFLIEALLETDDPEEFEEGDTASFLGQFSSAWGSGDISLNIEKVAGDTITNTVDAAFKSGTEDADWGSWLSQVYGVYDASEGCAQWAAEGQFPAMTVSDAFAIDATTEAELAEAGLTSDDLFCWTEPEEGACEGEGGCSMSDFVAPSADGWCSFDDGNTECFSFELANGSLGYFELPVEGASYYDTVAAEALGDWTQPTISFDADETWDCEAEGEFTDIDPSSILTTLQDCFAERDEAGGGRSVESCYDKELEDDVEDDGGVEYQDDGSSYGGGEEGEEGEDDFSMEDVDCDTDCTMAGEHEAHCEEAQAGLGC